MPTIEEINEQIKNGTYKPPQTGPVPSTQPSTIAPTATPGLSKINEINAKLFGTPITEKPVDTRSPYMKVSNKMEDYAELFTTGALGYATDILDQILGTASTGIRTQGVGVPGLGIGPSNVVSKDVADRIDKFREKYLKGAKEKLQIINNLNPESRSFAGQTAQVLGQVVPQAGAAVLGAPNLLLSISESAMNTQDSYEENIKKGMSKEQALKRAVPQFATDLMTTYFSNKVGGLGKFFGEKSIFKTRIAEIAKDASVEVLQEVTQSGLQNIATDKPWYEGLSETAKLTVIPGLLFGAAGNIHEATPEKVDELKQKVEEAVATVNTKIAENKPLTEEDKIVQVVTEGVDPFAVKEVIPGVPVAPSVTEALKMAEEKIKIETQGLSEKIKEEGGLTVDIKGGETPTEGYMYSPDKTTEVSMPVVEFGDNFIDNYIEKYYDKLSEDGAYLGAWIDNGKVYLDVSKNVLNEHDAIVGAKNAQQLGIYDIKNGETKYTDQYEQDTEGLYKYKGIKQGGTQEVDKGTTEIKRDTEITEPEKGKSILAQRLNESLPEGEKISEDYDKIQIVNELEKASKEIEADQNQALRDAFDTKKSITSRTVKLMEFAQNAKNKGDAGTQNSFMSSLRQLGTDTAQALNIYKAYGFANPETDFMESVVNARLGKVFVSSIDIKKAEKIKKAKEKVYKETTKEIKKVTDEAFKVEDAQTFFNSLIC